MKIVEYFLNKRDKIFTRDCALLFLRIPESLPSLHDKALAAAADAALSFSSTVKKKQVRREFLFF